MARKQWNICQLNKELASGIAARYSIDPFAALLLSQRAQGDEAFLTEFFDRSEEYLDPFLLPDMDKAVDRINDAIFDYERICIFGDYDADGVTSTTLLYSYLLTQGADVTWMLPDRVENGYGLSKDVVDKIHALGTKLIITVDNGISAVEEAEYIKELGMEMVITDHHLEGEALPDCVAIVDPHRKDHDCPFKEYAGVGVALKLCCALEGNDERVFEDFADIAAIGTVADLVPLIGENRKIVRAGLRLINRSPRPGVEALLNVSGLSGKQIESSNIAFGLAPRINAAGRMEKPDCAVDLLLAEEPEEAAHLAEHVSKLNQQRHAAEEVIAKEADAWLQKHPEQAHAPIIVVCGKGWHEGVLGIVASKLQDRYLRPVVVLTDKGDIAKGSARSIPGFSIYDAICSCKDMLRTYGGHELAAGLSLPSDSVDAFRDAIQNYGYSRKPVYPVMNIDCKLNPSSIDVSLLSAMDVLEPFGNSNPSPIFGLFKMTIDSIQTLGDSGQHKRLQLSKKNRTGQTARISAMKFHTPDLPWQPGDVVDLMVTLNRNEFRGQVNVTVIIKDIRPAGTDDTQMVFSEQLYDRIMAGQPLNDEALSRAIPDRNVFANVYRFLQQTEQQQHVVRASDAEYIQYKTGVPDLCRVRVTLEAMRELGLTETTANGTLKLKAVDGKVDLTEAPILKQMTRR